MVAELRGDSRSGGDDLAHPETRRTLPGYDAVEARCAIRPRPAGGPRHVHSRRRRQGPPALLLRLGRSCRALRWLRAAVADPGGAAPARILALAHPCRTAVKETACDCARRVLVPA